MSETQTEILSDEALKEVEGRRWVFSYGDERLQADESSRTVLLTVSERDSLCQTVRALKRQLGDGHAAHLVTIENLQETLMKHDVLRDQLAQANRRHVDAEEDLASAQLRIDELKSRLAQVEDELNTARAALAKLSLEQTQP